MTMRYRIWLRARTLRVRAMWSKKPAVCFPRAKEEMGDGLSALA